MISLIEALTTKSQYRGNEKPVIGSLARQPQYARTKTKSSLDNDPSKRIRRLDLIYKKNIPRPDPNARDWTGRFHGTRKK